MNPTINIMSISTSHKRDIGCGLFRGSLGPIARFLQSVLKGDEHLGITMA